MLLLRKVILRKTKEEYFENINVKDINDNKRLWKTIKSFFSKKGLNTNKLMLIEKNNLIPGESVFANMMNQIFTSITKQLNLKISPIKKIRIRFKINLKLGPQTIHCPNYLPLIYSRLMK